MRKKKYGLPRPAIKFSIVVVVSCDTTDVPITFRLKTHLVDSKLVFSLPANRGVLFVASQLKTTIVVQATS